MRFRKAKLTDADQIMNLLSQLGYSLSADQLLNKIKTFNREKHHQIMVAEENETLVGFITFVSHESFAFNDRYMYIDCLVVDQNCRGKGVGKKLMSIAEKFAHKIGCKLVELITRNHRRTTGTHAFYESIGYKDHIVADITYFAKNWGCPGRVEK